MKDVVDFEQFEDLLTDNNTIEKDSQPVEMDKTSPAKLAKNQNSMGPWSKVVLAQTGN